jgi:hypothetical protein
MLTQHLRHIYTKKTAAIYLFSDAEDGIQGLAHARQELSIRLDP